MSLSELLEQITDLKKELDSLLPMPDESQKILDRKFRLEFNYNSNHIEGNTLTYGETELLLIFDETRGSHPHRDYEEMKASDVTVEMVEQLAKENSQPLTESFIKNLNQILLVRPYWKDAITLTGETTKKKIIVGDYKKSQNSVRLSNGEIFNYASPIDTPALMADLIEWVRNEEEKKELHPVEIAALLHYRFVRIHPFDDGNGRISRLLMNYILIKNEYPPVIVKSDDRKNYLSALHDADTGNVESFKEYIANQLIWSLQLSIKAAKDENIEEIEDWKKKAALLRRELANRDAIKILKSTDVILTLINGRIVPFAFSILSGLTEFDDFFLTKKVYLVINGNKTLIQKQFNVDNALISNFKNSITFILSFEDFTKDHNSPFDIGFTLEFKFTKYKYEVYLLGNSVFDKLYHQDFTNSQYSEIVNKIGEFVISEIEQKVLDRMK